MHSFESPRNPVLPPPGVQLFIDFETAWAKGGYTLRSMPIAQYVRDERFCVHGVGWALGDGTVEWAFGEDVEGVLRGLDWSGDVVAHNVMFEAAILRWRYGIRPGGQWLDTAGMARYALGRACSAHLGDVGEHLGLGDKLDGLAATSGLTRDDWGREEHAETWRRLGEYCVRDVSLMRSVYSALHERVPAVEGSMMDLTARAFVDPGIELDVSVAERAAHEGLGPVGRLRKAGQDEEAGALAALVGSSDRLKGRLEALGVTCPLKVSATTGKHIPAFAKSDSGMKALLAHPDRRVRCLAEARVEVKGALNRTRSVRFVDVARAHYGRLPIELRYCGAHTGRWSGAGRSNLQNLPRGGLLRRALKAPPGMRLLVVDLAQIEARILACVAGEEGLLEAFRAGKDVYALFASDLYGVPGLTKDSHPAERQLAKSAVLGAGYHLGPPGFMAYCEANGITITEAQSRETIDGYRRLHPHIVALWSRLNDLLFVMAKPSETWSAMGETFPQSAVGVSHERIRLPSGRSLVFPGLHRRDGAWWCKGVGAKQVKVYGGLLTENVIQAMARDVMVEGLDRVMRRQRSRGLSLRFVLTVHDEVVFLVDADAVEACKAFALECMTQPVAWLPGCPIGAEAGAGDTYGGAK